MVNLLRVAAEDSVDVAVRQQGAIAFKNLVRRSWDVEGVSKCVRVCACVCVCVRVSVLLCV